MTKELDSGRRKLLAGAGAAAVGAVAAMGTRVATAAETAPQNWDHEVDVLCIGSGAAACTAAIVAAAGGAQVMVVEKLPLVGGTTGKSGGVAWIPNNALLKKKGIDDKKEDCLRYMARYAFPEQYDANSATLGMPEVDYRLMEAFYDNAAPAADKLQALGVVQFEEFRLYGVQQDAPDYADHLPENKVPVGRALQPVDGDFGAGGLLIERMESWLKKHKVPMLTEARVTRAIKDGERVIGVEASAKGKTLRIRARRGVIFGTGGFAHNLELVGMHQPAIYGACAMPGSTGDFLPIAQELGAKMGSLQTAWRAQVVLEEAFENRAVASVVFGIPADSMLLVNKYGQRVVNEKRNYNDRARVHFVYDPMREEYPNQLLFMLLDQRAMDVYGGDYPIPADLRESRFVIQGDSLKALASNIDARLQKLAPKIGGVRLASDFAANTAQTVARFNGFARKGVDADFGRGSTAYDRQWTKLFSPRRQGTRYPESKLPNHTLYPLADKGPYYCIIFGAGVLDTNAGPRINPAAQVLDARDNPIPGLYGAGNCIASPSRGAYYAAGGTIGAAITFGYIAANHALRQET